MRVTPLMPASASFSYIFGTGILVQLDWQTKYRCRFLALSAFAGKERAVVSSCNQASFISYKEMQPIACIAVVCSPLSCKMVEKLQLVQNSLTRLLTGTRWFEHIAPILAQLHWLPFRVLALPYESLKTSRTASLHKKLSGPCDPNLSPFFVCSPQGGAPGIFIIRL